MTTRHWQSLSPEERFLIHTAKTDFCWVWQGGTKKAGYGHFNVDGKKVIAHRWAYKHFVGPIPEDYEVDHAICNNPRCVNPAHLEAVTIAVNRQRRNDRHTHCPKGHSYNAENTRLQRDSEGYVARVCRLCERTRRRVSYHLRKNKEISDGMAAS